MKPLLVVARDVKKTRLVAGEIEPPSKPGRERREKNRGESDLQAHRGRPPRRGKAGAGLNPSDLLGDARIARVCHAAPLAVDVLRPVEREDRRVSETSGGRPHAGRKPMAASSMTKMPRRLAISRISPSSAWRGPACWARIARVWGVTYDSRRGGIEVESRRVDLGEDGADAAIQERIDHYLAGEGGRITSSPGPIPRALSIA